MQDVNFIRARQLWDEVKPFAQVLVKARHYLVEPRSRREESLQDLREAVEACVQCIREGKWNLPMNVSEEQFQDTLGQIDSARMGLSHILAMCQNPR